PHNGCDSSLLDLIPFGPIPIRLHPPKERAAENVIGHVPVGVVDRSREMRHRSFSIAVSETGHTDEIMGLAEVELGAACLIDELVRRYRATGILQKVMVPAAAPRPFG